MAACPISRRSLALGLPASLLAPAWNASAQGARRNILFIMADDMDLELSRRMPKLRRLVTEAGLEFRNHFVSLSLCAPSRASILRGQFAHNTGVVANQGRFGGFDRFFQDGLESSTIATWLRAAGYRTALLGKYLNNYPNARSGPNHIPPGWDTWFVPNGGDEYRQLDYSVNDDGTTRHFGHAPADYLNDVLLRQAQAFIRQAANDPPGRPFFLMLTPYLPHDPCIPPDRYRGRFPGVRVPRVPSFNEADVSDKPRWVRRLPPMDGATVREVDAFYRLRRQGAQALDDMVEAVIAALAGSGQLDNTFVFYSSDNGFQQGEHRIVDDKKRAYEECIRVPLVARGPGLPAGRAVRALTANVDLAPTFAALAGVTPPGFVDGRSLLPLLGGATPARWRRALLLESQPPEIVTPYQAYRGLRTADGQTFLRYDDGEGEYYDLSADPWQLDNRFDTMRPALKGALAAQLQALRDAGGAALRRAEEMAAGAT